MNEELYEGEFYTLTDDEGNESEFELIATAEVDGAIYLALVPGGETEEYVILKKELDENGEEMLVTIEDDEEFDKVADFFDDKFANEVDLDQ